MAECDKQGGDIEEFNKEKEGVESLFYKACELALSSGNLSPAMIWRRLHVTPEMATLLWAEMEKRKLITRTDDNSLAVINIKSIDDARW